MGMSNAMPQLLLGNSKFFPVALACIRRKLLFMSYDLTSMPPYIRKRITVAASGCWEMGGCLDKDGYAQVQFRKKNQRAHRWSFEFFVGPILLGIVNHKCSNRKCVFPGHLEDCTHAANMKHGNTGARSRAATRCPKDHEYTRENIIWSGPDKRWRKCRECSRLRCAEYVKARGDANEVLGRPRQAKFPGFRPHPMFG